MGGSAFTGRNTRATARDTGFQPVKISRRTERLAVPLSRVGLPVSRQAALTCFLSRGAYGAGASLDSMPTRG